MFRTCVALESGFGHHVLELDVIFRSATVELSRGSSQPPRNKMARSWVCGSADVNGDGKPDLRVAGTPPWVYYWATVMQFQLHHYPSNSENFSISVAFCDRFAIGDFETLTRNNAL